SWTDWMRLDEPSRPANVSARSRTSQPRRSRRTAGGTLGARAGNCQVCADPARFARPGRRHRLSRAFSNTREHASPYHPSGEVRAAAVTLQPVMLADHRRKMILNAVRDGRGVHVVELARRFEVSEMTVRRDLDRLARDGKLTRVHGGAVDAGEPPFAEIAV